MIIKEESRREKVGRMGIDLINTRNIEINEKLFS